MNAYFFFKKNYKLVFPKNKRTRKYKMNKISKRTFQTFNFKLQCTYPTYTYIYIMYTYITHTFSLIKQRQTKLVISCQYL